MKKNLIMLAVVLVLALVGGAAYFLKTYKAINIPPSSAPSSSDVDTLSDFTVPDGFRMSVFAEKVDGARVIAFDPRGVILVSRTSKGDVVALPDKDGDGLADDMITVVSGLNAPHGLAFRCEGDMELETCDLYVAEKDSLNVFSYDAEAMKAVDKKKLLDLPGGSLGTHFTRTLLFMPSPNEDILLISVGSSCNVCSESDERRAKILAYDIRTGKSEEYARGLRNSVFMEIHPVTGAIWATDMGRDGLGDDIPPDEINIVSKDGNYGWPICYGKNIHDTDYDKNTYFRNPCMGPLETPSHIDVPAHSAPLGLAFFPEEGWPEEYWYNIAVAYHGSWNRSVPTGYKIVRMKLDAQGNSLGGFEDLITGWLRPDGTKIGRPVDVKIFPGGTIYISDDGAGRVYKVIRG